MIIKTEEQLETNQKKLTSQASDENLNDLCKKIAIQEREIEESFEALELVQCQLDELMELYRSFYEREFSV